MTPFEKLSLLLRYHHNLTLQLGTTDTVSEKYNLNHRLGCLEEEIESLVFEKQERV